MRIEFPCRVVGLKRERDSEGKMPQGFAPMQIWLEVDVPGLPPQTFTVRFDKEEDYR